MATSPAAPTAAPPNFYDNLPAGGGEATSTQSKKPGEPDDDDELMQGFTGIIRVLNKMMKIKKELKPGIDKMKQDVKEMVAGVLKKNPADLDSGEDKGGSAGSSAQAEPSPAAKPQLKDETHAA